MVNWLQVTSKLRKKIFVAWFYNVYGRYFASSSLIDQFFGGNFEIEMKCTENDEEKPTDSTENFLQLSCFISQEVKYMLSGIKSVRYMQCKLLWWIFWKMEFYLFKKLQEQLTKQSPTLNRDAVYTRTVNSLEIS